MLSNFLILAVIAFGFSLMLGVKAEKFYKLLFWFIFTPLFTGIAYCSFLWLWQSAPVLMQILCVLLVPFFISALLRAAFPKTRWIQALQAVVFQTLIYAATFPFRFLWRAGSFLLQKERRTVRLNQYHAAVGVKPPIISEREKNQDKIIE